MTGVLLQSLPQGWQHDAARHKLQVFIDSGLYIMYAATGSGTCTMHRCSIAMHARSCAMAQSCMHCQHTGESHVANPSTLMN